jgi:hypothetical protein
MVRKKVLELLSDKELEAISINSDLTSSFINALEYSIVTNNYKIGLPYWSSQDPKFVATVTIIFHNAGIATTRVGKKYSEIILNQSLFNRDEVLNHRIAKKLKSMVMRNDNEVRDITLTKTHSGIREMGHNRQGFNKVAKHSFKLDLEMLQRYYEPIKLNLLKGIYKSKAMGKLTDKYLSDEANFEAIVTYVLNEYMGDKSYSMEKCITDNRGRAIHGITKRIGNIISSKDFRALIVTPPYLLRKDSEAEESIYYFIAELLGIKHCKDFQDKVAKGREAYLNCQLPELNLDKESDRDELHELIWLERLYNDLNRLYDTNLPAVLCTTPVEIDASASLQQFLGTLLNEERAMVDTNVIPSERLQDPWYIPEVRRICVKKVYTPQLFGSAKSAKTLLDQSNLNPSAEELKAIKAESTNGKFAVLNAFKKLVISGYNNHKPTIDVTIWGNTFQLEVTKWKPAGATIVVTEAYDSKTNKFRRSFTHEVKRVPDYARFKTSFLTLLVHCLDSIILSKLCEADRFMLPIHDAVILQPTHATQVRIEYTQQLEQMRKDRNSIIRDYLTSIGAVGIKTDVALYKLSTMIQQADENTPFSPTCMK